MVPMNYSSQYSGAQHMQDQPYKDLGRVGRRRQKSKGGNVKGCVGVVNRCTVTRWVNTEQGRVAPQYLTTELWSKAMAKLIQIFPKKSRFLLEIDIWYSQES